MVQIEHTIRINIPGDAVFYGRLAQLVLGVTAFALETTLCFWRGRHPWYNSYAWHEIDFYLVAPAMICTAIVAMMSVPGIFATRRPWDVHWHLTLLLDWLCLPFSAAAAALLTLQVAYSPSYSIGLFVVTLVCLYCTMFGLLAMIIITHKLNRRGKLPASYASREVCYNLPVTRPKSADGDGGSSPYDTYQQYEPQQQPQQPPQAVYETRHKYQQSTSSGPQQASGTHLMASNRSRTSNAPTAARWSGVSSADTAAVRSMITDAEVPPYSSRVINSQANTIQEEKA